MLNAKDYGIPQNRERVFCVSIRNDIEKEYVFPDKFDNGLRLKDMLEDEVNEKYYYSNEITKFYKENKGQGNILGNLVMDKWQDCMKRIYDIETYSPTINTMQGGNRQPKVLQEYRIRKLTPLECWRLMGFSDNDFNKVKGAGISDSQLYKQAGNSIVVDVLEAIFKNLFNEKI